MKIALIGYGVMGRQIEQICLERGHEVVFVLHRNRQQNWEKGLSEADVAIEFTEPDMAVENLHDCFRLGVPVVCGTTGWYGQLNEVSNSCLHAQGALFYASNFSIGVNLFFRLNRQLAVLMEAHAEYKARLEETHHTRKKDAPSGTAITLAEGLIESNKHYHSWTLGDASEAGRLPVQAIREDDVPGTHRIEWRSPNDSISISHEAFNRKGFATGAVIAAEFLHGKKGVFSMNDLFNTTAYHGL